MGRRNVHYTGCETTSIGPNFDPPGPKLGTIEVVSQAEMVSTIPACETTLIGHNFGPGGSKPVLKLGPIELVSQPV